MTVCRYASYEPHRFFSCSQVDVLQDYGPIFTIELDGSVLYRSSHKRHWFTLYLDKTESEDGRKFAHMNPNDDNELYQCQATVYSKFWHLYAKCLRVKEKIEKEGKFPKWRMPSLAKKENKWKKNRWGRGKDISFYDNQHRAHIRVLRAEWREKTHCRGRPEPWRPSFERLVRKGHEAGGRVLATTVYAQGQTLRHRLKVQGASGGPRGQHVLVRDHHAVALADRRLDWSQALPFEALPPDKPLSTLWVWIPTGPASGVELCIGSIGNGASTYYWSNKLHDKRQRVRLKTESKIDGDRVDGECRLWLTPFSGPWVGKNLGWVALPKGFDDATPDCLRQLWPDWISTVPIDKARFLTYDYDLSPSEKWIPLEDCQADFPVGTAFKIQEKSGDCRREILLESQCADSGLDVFKQELHKSKRATDKDTMYESRFGLSMEVVPFGKKQRMSHSWLKANRMHYEGHKKNEFFTLRDDVTFLVNCPKNEGAVS